ncbi:MAG: secondary thiamine-phosphate synthase enzyme YjbQ [Synechococcaceae cyanobacterium]
MAMASQHRSTSAWWLTIHPTASMRQSLCQLSLQTGGEGFTDISAALNAEIGRSGLRTGLATVHVLHTSCSLTINENADPRVLRDLAAYLQALVPQEGVRPVSGLGNLRPYLHDDEGPDDMPAHIRTALTATSLSLGFEAGRLVLGTWQAVYLWEHRARPHRRRLSLHLLGE